MASNTCVLVPRPLLLAVSRRLHVAVALRVRSFYRFHIFGSTERAKNVLSLSLSLCLLNHGSLVVDRMFAPYHTDLRGSLALSIIRSLSLSLESSQVIPCVSRRLKLRLFFSVSCPLLLLPSGEAKCESTREKERETMGGKGEGETPCVNPLAGRGRERVAHEHLRASLFLLQWALFALPVS